MELTWLDEPTVDALRAALRTVAPDLAEATIVPRGLEPSGDPQYCTASAVVDGRFVVKFAWAGPGRIADLPSGADPGRDADGHVPAAAARGDGSFPRSGDADPALGAGDAVL